MAKRNEFKATETWGDLLRKSEHAAKESEGEVYRIKPVDLETFVLSHEYLGQDLWGLSDVQKDFLEKGSDLENGINFFVLFVGKGGGKNWSSGVLFLYIVYKLLCMYDPHKYLNHNSAKAITLINVAINETQARKNFFDPLANILRASGDKAFRQFGFNPETDIQKTQVVFPKNIEIMSANSRAGGIEGYDLLVAMADEVDDVEFHSVDKIVDTLRTSSQSRFEGHEKVMVISYQRYVGSSGKINEFYSNAGNFSHVYARKYASWEFHPARTREDFESYFKENPEKAACMYGSVVTGSFVDSWIKDSKRIKNAMNWNRTWVLDWPLPYDPHEVGTEEWKNKISHREWRGSPLSEHIYVGEDGESHQLDPYDMPIAKVGDPNQTYVFCGDPALGSEVNGGDGYGIALAHREIVRDERGRKYVRPIIDLAFRFTGRMFEEGQVQMVAIEKLITKLKDQYGYNIKYFSFDGWNCIAKGSKVLTEEGYRNVETLSVGDTVVGKEGLNTVQELESKDNVPSYIVKMDTGLELEVTRNHPLYVKNKGFVEAKNLSIGDSIVYGEQAHFGNHENIPEALVFGYLISKLTPKDYQLSFNGTSNDIGAFLSAFYENSASIDIENSKIEFTTVSEKVSKDIQLLLLQLGVKAYRKDGYKVTILGSQIIPFSEVVGFLSDRKQETLKELVSKLKKPDFIDSVKIVDIVESTSTIVHMEVDGDHTYIAEGLLSHNSASLTQWIAKTYRDALVKDFNLVETRDYTALRDALFGEAPPSNGKGEKESNGGIDLPWHPIVYEELRELREDRCFTGDTRICLLDGTTPTLEELANSDKESFWVYSYDSAQDGFVPALAHSARITYHTTQITKVTLEDGTVIKSTPEHKYMTSNGEWTEAQELIPGTSLLGMNKVQLDAANRTVTCVETVTVSPTAMYDITVDGTHNFLLEDGHIIVSNSKNPAKVDHPANGGKDIADVIAKAVYLLTYDWPFVDILTAGINSKQQELAAKLKTGVATDDEKQKYSEELYSKTIGLGSWKELKNKQTINLKDIFPQT